MARVDSDRLMATIGTLYEAALVRDIFPEAIRGFADLIGADSSHLMVVSSDGRECLGLADREDPAAHAEYLRDYYQDDIRLPRLAAVIPGRVIREKNIWSDEEKADSALYHDYQRRNRLFEITGTPLGIDDHATWIGFGRNREEPFEDACLRAINQIVPHVRNAVRLSLTIERERNRAHALGELWSESGRAIIVVGGDGRVGYMNSSAETMRRAGAFRIVAGKPIFRDRPVSLLVAEHVEGLRRGRPVAAAAAAVFETIAFGPIGMRISTATAPVAGLSDAASLVLLMTPLGEATVATPAEVRQFATLFRLSPSETRVLEALVRREDHAAYATGNGIGIDTVRKHIKSVMAKTGCVSQKDVLRMVERFCFLSLR